MAKNIGLIQFEGSIGDLVAYQRNGSLIIQRKGGFKGERLKTEERYESVRKRQSEFGKCAKLASSIKRALSLWLQFVPENMIYNHIQSMVMGIKNCDVSSEKGTKTFAKGIATPEGVYQFKKFQLNPKRSLSAGVEITSFFDFETGTVSVCPHQYKLKPSMQLGAEVLLLQLDLDTYEYQVHSSGKQYCDVLHQTMDFKIDMPITKGFLVALLFVGKCIGEGKSEMWMRDVEVGFGVLDFKLFLNDENN
ncbi:hypothetical protein [Flavobacterium sp.]|uniref:hypothetical protein n=1 Tax=Flavobacterium sp. TaxID=239 RepID=UPI00260DA559|nr:hypothetical protein [Flavobacterium sp.]